MVCGSISANFGMVGGSEYFNPISCDRIFKSGDFGISPYSRFMIWFSNSGASGALPYRSSIDCSSADNVGGFGISPYFRGIICFSNSDNFGKLGTSPYSK